MIAKLKFMHSLKDCLHVAFLARFINNLITQCFFWQNGSQTHSLHFLLRFSCLHSILWNQKNAAFNALKNAAKNGLKDVTCKQSFIPKNSFVTMIQNFDYNCMQREGYEMKMFEPDQFTRATVQRKTCQNWAFSQKIFSFFIEVSVDTDTINNTERY